jgi:putative radical SAM enzyme (TIGR03279 family)
MYAGLIAAIAPGSLAKRLDLRPGDELLSINGHALRDVIDVRFYSAEEHLTLEVRRSGDVFSPEAQRRCEEPLGLDFAEFTFDGIRRCNNHCEFCFVTQMPPGLRPSLYVKDDDYRLSFLSGSYVTLTNLGESDWARIEEQHLSPLYVSVHATDPGLRRKLLRNPTASDVLPQLRRLADLGIEVHTQIVVLPGLNDGSYLDQSIGALVELYPAVRSASVVPVGLTRFHRGNCRVHTEAERWAVFEQVTGWQVQLRDRLGVNFVYLSDEWYLRLGEEAPPLGAYDGLDLTENGVGLVSSFEIANSKSRSAIRDIESATMVTGTLFAPVLQQVAAHLSGVRVVSVVNDFFGDTVTVAGLLTGQDVIAQLREQELGDVVLLPPAMFGGPEGQSLDELRPQEVGEALGREVAVGEVTSDGKLRPGTGSVTTAGKQVE